MNGYACELHSDLRPQGAPFPTKTGGRCQEGVRPPQTSQPPTPSRGCCRCSREISGLPCQAVYPSFLLKANVMGNQRELGREDERQRKEKWEPFRPEKGSVYLRYMRVLTCSPAYDSHAPGPTRWERSQLSSREKAQKWATDTKLGVPCGPPFALGFRTVPGCSWCPRKLPAAFRCPPRSAWGASDRPWEQCQGLDPELARTTEPPLTLCALGGSPDASEPVP